MVSGDDQCTDTGCFQTMEACRNGIMRRCFTVLGKVTGDEYQVRLVLQCGVQQSVPNRLTQFQHLTLGLHVLVKISLLVNLRLRNDMRV